MTVTELLANVATEFENLGFTSAQGFHQCEYVRVLQKGESYDRIIGGYTIDIDIVHRRNATAENTSVRISIVCRTKYSGFTYASEKVTDKMGHKAINKRIENILTAWQDVTSIKL